MKTYNIDELNASQKTSLDYINEHQKMLSSLKAQHPQSEEDPKGLWELPRGASPHWLTDNILNPDGTKQEGSGRVPPAKVEADS
jgi:hypothetical protein